MNILLIGNFAPPYEEENLYNISLLRRLEIDGNSCTVINTSDNAPTDNRFIHSRSYIDFVFKLIRACFGQDIVHFSTKGYLRLGLLKLMTSILIGKLMGAKTFITIHSELFSIAGQMRSPVGGRQTLFTSFTVADKIICSDEDTYNVASMYMKKSNFELIPSFIFASEKGGSKSNIYDILSAKDRVIVFSNLQYPSFVFDVLRELITKYPIPDNTAVVLSVTKKNGTHLTKLINDIDASKTDNIILIDPDNVDEALAAYATADMIMRPMSCDGVTFFKEFAISIKKPFHQDEYTYFPSGLLFIKEGSSTELCLCIINAMLCVEAGTPSTIISENSYQKIKSLYFS
jgi:hypothetical protein